VKPLELLVTEKQNGAAILLGELIGWMHQFLTANKDEIYRCKNSKSTELEDIKFYSVDPAEFDSANEDEDQPTEPNLFHEK
jgi:hypothetical protein